MRGKYKLISALLCLCLLIGTLPQSIVPVMAAGVDVPASSSTTSLAVTAPTFTPVMVGYGQPKAESIAIKNTGSGYIRVTKAEVSEDSFMLTGPTGTLFLMPGVTDTSYSVQPKPGLPVGTHTATITVTDSTGQTVTADISFEVKPTGSIVNPPDGTPAADAPQNLTELREADPSEVAKVSKFDSRNYGIVPPTKDQGRSNICWAYAPITASTISVLRSGIDPQASKDSLWLSPEVLAYNRHNHPADPLGNTTAEYTGGHWFSDQGDIVYTPPLLSQWCGPVVSNSSLVSDPRIDPFANAAYKMESAVTIESNSLKTDMAARNAIKEAIVKYGAVTFSYNNMREREYHNAANENGMNFHACTIIGWDDTIPANKFQPGSTSQPGGWLVKNSYDSLPYFWLSYDCNSSVVWAFDYAPADKYDYNYFYDSASQNFGMELSTIKDTAANVFQAKKGTDQTPEYLKAVNVCFTGKDVHCEVKVYTDLTDPNNPESGQCVATVSEDYQLSGYYTLQLDQPVTLAPNSYFSVVAKVSSNSGGSAYIRAGLNSSSRSYVKNSSGDWGNGPSRAVRIKAFTKLGDPDQTPQPNPTTDISSAVITLPVDSFVYTGNQITPDCTVTVNNQTLTAGTDYTVSYSNNINVGTATVTVTGMGSYHGSVSRTFAITQASFTATVSLADWTYGQNANDPVISGNRSNGTVTYSYAASENGTYTATKPTNAGTYYIKAQIEATSNYGACTTAPERFTIHKANQPSNYHEIPQTAVLTYNGSLADISLPSGWSWSDPTQSIAPDTTVSVTAEYFDQDNYQTTTATVQITKEPLPAPILTPEATPTVTIDYIAESLGGFDTLGTYTINGAPCTIDPNGTLSINSAWFGNVLTIVKVGNGATTKNSAPQILSIPNRPAPPQNLNGIHEDFVGNHNGQINGVSGDMEYQVSGGVSWIACVGNSMTNLVPDTYLIRMKATDHSFAGLPTTVNIGPGKVPTYTLTLTAPVFSEVTAGYQQPEALPIIIANSGNHEATISSALLNGTDAASFILFTGNSTVASGVQDSSYLIQPKENLPAGSYSAQIVIGYDGGMQAQAEISFTVRAKPEQPTPNPGSSTGGTTYYSIRVAPSAHGTIAISPQIAAKGMKVTLTASPDAGYVLGDLTLQDSRGSTIPATKESDTTYTFTMPGSPVTIAPVFVRIEPQISFTDVSLNAYYYDAVVWAVKQGITMGTSTTTFSPDAACTRAQMVTFLWRAAGSPNPSATACNFTDVAKNSDDYQAILWAAERGITTGTSETTFQPAAVCSRGQMATFLYRYSGSPAVIGAHPFTDVPNNVYYHDAVIWAVQNGVTRGTSATTFSPADNCTRGQMITLLYRLLSK